MPMWASRDANGEKLNVCHWNSPFQEFKDQLIKKIIWGLIDTFIKNSMIIIAIYTIYYKNNKIQQTLQAHKTKIKKKMTQTVSKMTNT